MTTPVAEVIYLCDGPGCMNTVDPDTDGLCCSEACLVAFLREYGEAS